MKLFFNHIPKAGGNSVHKTLAAVFGRFYDNLNTNGFGQIKRATSLDKLTRYTRSPNNLAFGAHVTCPEEFAREEMMSTCLGMSIVRDPAARFASYYAYTKSAPHLPYHAAANTLDLDAFYDHLRDDISMGMNLPSQRAQLFYEIEVKPSGMLGGAETVDAIRAFFDAHYILVGVTERMDLFYDCLQRLLRVLLDEPALIVEQTHSNRTGGGSMQLSDANRADLRDVAYTDMDMHQWLLDEGVYFNEGNAARLAKLLR